MARRQSYEFTHYLLPEEALLAPEATWNALRGPDSTVWLMSLWEQARQYANAVAPPAPAEGLQAEQCLAGTHEAVLISLPSPVERPDAWYALLVRTPAGPAPFRYFLLEVPAGFVPVPPDTRAEPGPTLLTERHADTQMHLVHGPGPLAPTATTVARFLVAAGQLVASATAPPADSDEGFSEDYPAA